MKPLGPAAKLSSRQVDEFYRVLIRLPLKRVGQEWRCPCPLHEGEDDNFAVNKSTGQWFCHSVCSRGGDVYELYAALNHVDIGTSIRTVSKHFGLTTGNGHNGAEVNEVRAARQMDTAAGEGNGIADEAAAKLGAAGKESEKKAKFVEVKRTEYLYHDAAGVEVYFIRRIDLVDTSNPRNKKKGFKAYRHKGKGEVLGLGEVAVVPYRLPDLVAAGEVFVVEGEKCVEAMREIGFAATCNPFGAGNWRPEFAQYFGGKLVRVLPDNDEDKGRPHAAAVVANLLPVAREVKLVELPGLPAKGDIVEWLAAGGTVEQLRALVEAAEVSKVPAAADPVRVRELSRNTLAELEDGKLTELSLANIVVQRHGFDLRHVSATREWFRWDERRWRMDEKQSVKEIFKATVEGLEAKYLRSRSRVLGAMDLASSDGEVAAVMSEFDSNTHLLNLNNGTVDLRSGEMRSHSRGDMQTKVIPFGYNPRAKAPRWERFLAEVFEPHPEIVEWIQKAVGYSITGDVREHCFFFMHGDGRNGKGVFAQVLRTIFGEYAHQADFKAFEPKYGDGPLDGIANFRGNRLVVAMESREGARLDEALMKTLTGGDPMRVRLLNQNSFEMWPTWKIWLGSNNKPVIRGTEPAIWARVRLIPFKVSFEGREDKELPERLMREAEGIIAWAVEGALRWREEGLNPLPEGVALATQGYRIESDIVGQFLEECTEAGEQFSVRANKFYQAYRTWAERSGKKPMEETAFGLKLRDRKGITKGKDKGGAIYYGVYVVDPEKKAREAEESGG